MNHCKQSVLFLKQDTYHKVNMLMRDTGLDASSLLELLVKMYEKLKLMKTSLLLVTVYNMLSNKETSNEMMEIMNLLSTVFPKNGSRSNQVTVSTPENQFTKPQCDIRSDVTQALSMNGHRAELSEPVQNVNVSYTSSSIPSFPASTLSSTTSTQIKSAMSFFPRQMPSDQTQPADIRSDLNAEPSRDLSIAPPDRSVEALIDVYIGNGDIDFSGVEDSPEGDIFTLQEESPMQLEKQTGKVSIQEDSHVPVQLAKQSGKLGIQNNSCIQLAKQSDKSGIQEDSSMQMAKQSGRVDIQDDSRMLVEEHSGRVGIQEDSHMQLEKQSGRVGIQEDCHMQLEKQSGRVVFQEDCHMKMAKQFRKVSIQKERHMQLAEQSGRFDIQEDSRMQLAKHSDRIGIQEDSCMQLEKQSEKICVSIGSDITCIEERTDKYQQNMGKDACDSTVEECERENPNCNVESGYVIQTDSHNANETIKTAGDPSICKTNSNFVVTCNNEKQHRAANSGIGDFSCDLCSAVFPKAWRLRKHKKNVHKSGEDHLNQCNHCGKSYPTSFILNYHKNYLCRNVKRPYQCLQCKLKFSNEMSKTLHKCSLDESKPFSCDQCTFKAAHAKDLEVHNGKHTNSKAFKCELCDFQTNWKKNLKEHTQKHNGLKKFNCELCSFMTTDKHNLRSHVKLKHTDKREFICEECGKSYKDDRTLNIHKKTHSDDWLKCSYPNCQYETHWKCNLRSHMISHAAGMKNGILCEQCGQTFTNKKHMIKHQALVHKNTNYKCSMCNYKANNSQSLNSHMRKHSEKNIKNKARAVTKDVVDKKHSDKKKQITRNKTVQTQKDIRKDRHMEVTEHSTFSEQSLPDSYNLGIYIPSISLDKSVSNTPDSLPELTVAQPNKSNETSISTRPPLNENFMMNGASPLDVTSLQESDFVLLKKLITDPAVAANIINNGVFTASNPIVDPIKNVSAMLENTDSTNNVASTGSDIPLDTLPYCSTFDTTCNIGVTSLCGESISQNGDQVYSQHAFTPFRDGTSHSNKPLEELFSPFTADFLKDSF